MATTTHVDTTMSVRAIGARTDFAGTAATDLSAEDDRLINAAFGPGKLRYYDFKVAAGAAATMNVIVGSGTTKNDLYLVEGVNAGQGTYLARLDLTTKTIALGAADPSNPRIDEVYLVILDNAYDSSGFALPILALRTGTAAGTPSAPGADASWDAYALLCTIDVPAAAVDIEDCTLTDERAYADGVPQVGQVSWFLGNDGATPSPDGPWLRCTGASVATGTYPALEEVINSDGARTTGGWFIIPALQVTDLSVSAVPVPAWIRYE